MKLKLLAFAVILRGLAAGQVRDGVSAPAADARITIESRTVPVLIRLDTTLLGATPIFDLPLTPGTHLLRYYPSAMQSWFFPPVLETLVVGPSSSVRRLLQPLLSYHLTSEPCGAAVISGDSTIGVTPCVLSSADTMGVITFFLDNYQKTEAVFSASGPHLHVVLMPLTRPGSLRPPESLSGDAPRRQLPIYLSTAAAIVTGFTAVYLKMKADSYYDEYRLTGNPGTLDRTRGYDTASGIALAASEISLLTLTFILLSR